VISQRRRRRRKNFLEHRLPILKDLPQIGSDEKFLHKRTAPYGVVDAIADDGPAVFLDKRVLVHPKRIGAARLSIDKTAGWFPDLDFALPTKRDATQTEPIIEQGSLANFRGRRKNFKMEPRWREVVQINRIGEKFEYLFAPMRQPNLGLKSVCFHEKLFSRSLDVIAQHQLLRTWA